VTLKFPQEHWYRIFKTPNDLTTFLKLFSDCFHVQSNLVTLLQKPKISENHIHHAEKVLHKNNFNIVPVIGDFKLNEPVSNGMMITNNNNGSSRNKNYKSDSPVEDGSLSNGRNSTNDLPSMGFGHSFQEVRLENLCTRNCPAKVTYVNSEGPTVLPPTPTAPPKNDRERERRVNLTLKQRISNLVTKTLAENEEKDKRTPNALQTVNNGSLSSSNSSSTATSPVHSRSYFHGDTWKIKVLQNTQVISTVKESLFVCDAIMKSSPSSDERVVISFDCEGVNLGVKGQLTVIEIGTVRGEAFIFDLQQCPQMVIDGGLKELLEDDNVIKIIHDCRNDSYNLYAQYNILLRNVFDTQVSGEIILVNFLKNEIKFCLKL
jgi:exonuclease 3'-5' domain-containing protein 1